MGEGVVYETLNLASLWKVPLLIIVENNQYAQTTPIANSLAGSIIKRVLAFDISAGEVESNDVAVLHPRFENLIKKVRSEKRPHVEIVHSYRLNAHSKGDDFRSKDEIELWRRKDPMGYFDQYIDQRNRRKIKDKVNIRLAEIEKKVEDLPFSELI
jgi:TPP-dependent pyruvate/acetoin dehydrogenase alpha subunit